MSLLENQISTIKLFSLNMRKNILDMAFWAGANSSHFGGALSITDIVSYLYSFKMKMDKKNPLSEDRDRFILSKGHGCLAYYSALSEVGYINKEQLKSFEKNDSDLLGHPVINRNLGIDFSNGSLGMGLSLGIGVAISLKKKFKKNNVFVILGDGECGEGSVWEAAMSAPNYGLDNLIVIIDHNKFQQTGSVENIMNSGKLIEKWNSFGWNTKEVDGHDINDIHDKISINTNKKPLAIIANTIKGKGFSFSENNNDWHHAVMTKKMYEIGIEELKK
tara:strand:- start:26 stop:853 length:828 start_codon:yes stop_codon:yes gene_type:complete